MGPEGPTASNPRTALSSTTSRRASYPSRISIDGVARTAATRARITSRPAPSPPQWATRRRLWAASRPSAKPPSSRAVETDAEPREPLDRRGRGPGEAIDDGAVAEPVAGGDRVGGMERRRVVRPQRRREPALRPERRALRAKRPLREQDDRAGRELERRHQPRDAGADDDDAPAQRERLGRHSASIRSTARRAGAAIAGSIVTSPAIVSSAWRILASVIRFMWGQRAQGLTNSTSG